MKRILLILVPLAAVAVLLWRLRQSEHRRPALFDPLLGLRGSGRGLWGNEDAVEYIRRLREG